MESKAFSAKGRMEGERDASQLHLSLRKSQEASGPAQPAVPAISNVEHTSPIHPPHGETSLPPSPPFPLITCDLFVNPASRPIPLATWGHVAGPSRTVTVFQPSKQVNRPRDREFVAACLLQDMFQPSQQANRPRDCKTSGACGKKTMVSILQAGGLSLQPHPANLDARSHRSFNPASRRPLSSTSATRPL